MHPAGVARGDPAFRVAVLAVIDVRELVQRMLEIAVGTGLGATTGEREVVLGRNTLQLIAALC